PGAAPPKVCGENTWVWVFPSSPRRNPPAGKTYSPRNHLVTSSRDPYRSFQRSFGAFPPQEIRPPPSHRGGRRSHRPPPLSFPLPGLIRLLAGRRGKYPSRRYGDPEGTYGRGAS